MLKEELKQDILAISDVINTALMYNEIVDLSLLNDKLHEMYLKLDN